MEQTTPKFLSLLLQINTVVSTIAFFIILLFLFKYRSPKTLDEQHKKHFLTFIFVENFCFTVYFYISLLSLEALAKTVYLKWIFLSIFIILTFVVIPCFFYFQKLIKGEL